MLFEISISLKEIFTHEELLLKKGGPVNTFSSIDANFA